MNKIEILGWDVLNVIFNHLKPRDVILISTSINTNFCKCVKSAIYSDHILLNKKHKFENSQPGYAILDFHISRLKYHDDSYYIAMCAKNNTCTDLFENIINSLTQLNLVFDWRFPKYIEQYFGGTQQFGRSYRYGISRNGDGLDKIILKIVLPKLPIGIKYVNSPYNIINSIRLDIGGVTFFEYTFSQIEHLDFITQLFNSVHNVIYYYMDLGSFFKKSGENLDFYGLRLVDLDYHETAFYVHFNDIFSIIENNIDPITQQYDEIKNLSIQRRVLLAKYHRLTNILPKPINQIINRWIPWNHSCDACDSVEIDMSPKSRLLTDSVMIKKLILCFNQKVMLNSCFIFVGDFNAIKLMGNGCALDKYVFDVIKVVPHVTIKILIKFADSVKNINIDAFFETEQEFIYDGGMAFW